MIIVASMYMMDVLTMLELLIIIFPPVTIIEYRIFTMLAPSEETESPSEEDKVKQQIKERSREEFLGSVAFEGKL